MRRISIAVVFLGGIAFRCLAQSAISTLAGKDAHTSDMAAIEKLHQEDIEATLSQDPKGLMNIWSEDAVRFNPPGLPAVGKPAIQAENEKVRAQYPGFKVLSYVPRYRDLQINGDLASEWFERESEYKLSTESPPATW